MMIVKLFRDQSKIAVIVDRGNRYKIYDNATYTSAYRLSDLLFRMQSRGRDIVFTPFLCPNAVGWVGIISEETDK